MKNKKRDCICCSRKFRPKDGRQKFCNRSCAATYNNVIFPKRKARLCECGGPISRGSVKCRKCRKQETLTANLLKPMRDLLCKGASRAKYNHIRRLARQVWAASGRSWSCPVM